MLVSNLAGTPENADWRDKVSALEKFSTSLASLTGTEFIGLGLTELLPFFRSCVEDLRSSLVRAALDCLVIMAGVCPNSSALMLSLLTPSFIGQCALH